MQLSTSMIVLPIQLACQLICTRNDTLLYPTTTTPMPVTTTTTTTTTTPAPTPAPVVLPAGYTAFPDVGFAYKYDHARLTWNGARKYCAKDNATLAVIDSVDKVKYAMQLKSYLGCEVRTYVGIHRYFDDADWVSARNGSSLAALPWKSDDFENDQSYKCATVHEDGTGLAREKCDENLEVICEFEL